MRGPLRKGDLAALTKGFSAAAFDAPLWEGAMDAAAQVTGSVGSVLLPLKGQLPTVPVESIHRGLGRDLLRDGMASAR